MAPEQLCTKKIDNKDDDDDDNDDSIEDVTPTITKKDIQTVNIIPGITIDDDETGIPPPYDSRWTIRKCFTDIPITHSSFAGTNNKTLRFELQGDSGANCTATDQEELLWQIKYFDTPIKVKTFDGENNDVGEHRTIDAIGAGILKMVDNNNHIMDYYCLLIPNSTGTVISLDKFMRDNRTITKFHQVGTVYGTGYMKFYDKQEHKTHSVTMEERNGLWFASNSILMPPTSEGPTKRSHEPSCSPRINKLRIPATPNKTNDDVDAQHFYAATLAPDTLTPTMALPPTTETAPATISVRTMWTKQIHNHHKPRGHACTIP